MKFNKFALITFEFQCFLQKLVIILLYLNNINFNVLTVCQYIYLNLWIKHRYYGLKDYNNHIADNLKSF